MNVHSDVFFERFFKLAARGMFEMTGLVMHGGFLDAMRWLFLDVRRQIPGFNRAAARMVPQNGASLVGRFCPSLFPGSSCACNSAIGVGFAGIAGYPGLLVDRATRLPRHCDRAGAPFQLRQQSTDDLSDIAESPVGQFLQAEFVLRPLRTSCAVRA